MSTTTTESPPDNDRQESRTRIIFDLRDVLSEEELAQFERSAAEAGAEDLTEHFLNISLREGGGA